MFDLFKYVRFLLGFIRGYRHVSKYGRTVNADQDVITDVWDGSDDGTVIWVAPTEARTHDIESDDENDVSAIGTLTLSANVSDGDTITIGSKVYVFQTVLTDVDGNVLIGAAATNSIDNLIAAINLTGGAGSTYAASMTNVISSSAVIGAGDTMIVYSYKVIATTEDSATAAWGGVVTVAGTSAQLIKIWGLTSWAVGAKETIEYIYMRGSTKTPTVNKYVIIYRKRVVDNGNTSINAGKIIATAQTDATITSQINALKGSTHMAIYGIPTGETLFIERVYANMNRFSGASSSVDLTLLVNSIPNKSLIPFVFRHTASLQKAGTSALTVPFKKPKIITGPAIIKIAANASAADTDVSVGFEGFIAPSSGGTQVS